MYRIHELSKSLAVLSSDGLHNYMCIISALCLKWVLSIRGEMVRALLKEIVNLLNVYKIQIDSKFTRLRVVKKNTILMLVKSH